MRMSTNKERRLRARMMENKYPRECVSDLNYFMAPGLIGRGSVLSLLGRKDETRTSVRKEEQIIYDGDDKHEE